MPPTHPSQAAVAAAYRTLIAHETEPKEQDFYRTRLQRLEQATEPECEFDCRSRVAAAGVGVYCPQCSAKCADTDLATELAKAIRAAWVDRLDWDELAQGALGFLTSTGRLIPAGGRGLEFSEVEALRSAWEELKDYRVDGYARPHVNQIVKVVGALFPATEPAEDAPCAICNVNETNHAGVSYYHPFTTELGPFDDDGNDRPTPAEPAEEETKAEETMAGAWDDGFEAGYSHAGRESTPSGISIDPPLNPYDERNARSASLPVVPAPTETGPWQTLQEVPEGVTRVVDSECELWVQEGGQWFSICQLHNPAEYAPFVAAEEG